jgi:hypothetical protein
VYSHGPEGEITSDLPAFGLALKLAPGTAPPSAGEGGGPVSGCLRPNRGAYFTGLSGRCWLIHNDGNHANNTGSFWVTLARTKPALGFTNHTRDLVIDGVTYRAASGISPTTAAASSGLAVDNLDIQAILSSDAITEADLLAGVHDDAYLEVFLVNWADPSMGRIVLHAGRLIQLGPPAQVYAEPVDALAARLTGPASVLRAPTSASGDNTCTLTVAATSVTASCAKPPGAGVHALLVRPDWARMGGPLTGRLRAVLFRGPHCDHLLETAVGDVLVREPGTPRGQVGDQLSWTLDRVWALGQASASAAPE